MSGSVAIGIVCLGAFLLLTWLILTFQFSNYYLILPKNFKGYLTVAWLYVGWLVSSILIFLGLFYR